MGSRLRKTSTGLSSARLPTVSAIFARRAFRSSALARIAFSIAGQYFCWSGVNCNAAFTRSIRMSVSGVRSGRFIRSGVAAEGVCAWAIGDGCTLLNWVDLNQRVGLGLGKEPTARALPRRIESYKKLGGREDVAC